MMTAALTLSLFAAGASLAVPRRMIETLAVTVTLAQTGLLVTFTASVLSAGVVTELDGWLAADALSVLIAVLTAVVATTAALHSVSYLREDMRGRDLDHGAGLRDVRRYYVLFHLFVFTMLAVPLSNSLGVVWVAIEATTLASVFLVSYYRTREALEAAWKYVIVGSMGIALALFGTILTYYAAVPALGLRFAMNWTTMSHLGSGADGGLMRLAFLFILVGYGTKAGLAPMHTWLPDAHSEAPSPISALLSGVLLNAALYTVLRFYAIATPSAGRTYLDLLLLGFGLLSLVVAAVFILRQRDYKRLLAYSSIEHMGIVTTAIAFGGPLGITAGMLQLVCHALAKSLMFFSAGHVLLRFETKEIEHVTGALRALPMSATFLLVGGLALAGAPPFGLFISETAVLAAGFAAGLAPAALLVLACLVVIFVAFVAHLNGMVFGHPPAGIRIGERPRMGLLAMALSGLGLVVLGVSIPSPLAELIAGVGRALGAGS